jgi:hypothetical protein
VGKNIASWFCHFSVSPHLLIVSVSKFDLDVIYSIHPSGTLHLLVASECECFLSFPLLLVVREKKKKKHVVVGVKEEEVDC